MQTSTRRNALFAGLGAGLLALTGRARAADKDGKAKVVYHVTRMDGQPERCLDFVRNHLAGEPGVTIVVVANGSGIDFLLNGAKTKSGAEFAGNVGDFAGQGVKFLVCENTMKARNISKDKVLMDANFVPSGVVEAARLQNRDGYAYISP
jgi:intracellular sulfur oxidation DsrE/DsrF family protein